MTDYEIEDIAGTMIPFRNLSILSVGSMKRLVWQWDAYGNFRSHSLIVEDGSALTAPQLRGILDSEIKGILAKYPDEEFVNK